ncbi:MAG: glycosyltransferase family 4 protein [Candidatus Binatia bacterium]
MRLLLFNMGMDVDDPPREFISYWVQELARRMEFIHVITMRAGKVEVPHNVRVYSVGKEKGYGEPRRAVEFYRHLSRILREGRIDVCFSHMMPIFTVLAAPVLRLKGIPIVTWYAHRQITTVLKLAHAVSHCMVSNAATAYRYRHDKLVIVGHGIDTTLFSPEGAESPNPPLLLSVGRFSPIKDLLVLIEAVDLLRQRGHTLRCLLVGGAPEQEQSYIAAVRRQVKTLGLESTVQFAGAVPYKEVAQWYRRCFAHVNLCPTGALDKAALEAMACGKPSLVANEGFREVLGRWTDRLLFEHGNATDLVQRIEQLLRMDSAALRTMGTDLRRNVVAHHSLERLAERLTGLFHEVKRA